MYLPVTPKVPRASDAGKHKAGGGNVEICTYHAAYDSRIGVCHDDMSLSMCDDVMGCDEMR